MKNANLIIVVLILSLSVIFSSCSNETSTNPEMTIEEKLQNYLDYGIKDYNGKGISFAVIIPGKFNWQGASGISHQDVSITTDMLFSAGSITKTFTALTILQLAEEGVLSLEDSLHQWLPDYPYVDNTITIRQLLQHTSGIFNLTAHPTIWQDIFSNPDKSWDPDDLLRTYLMPADFPKGTYWTYSNTGYILLRMIIEKATNSTITSAYRNRLFNPLGLEDSYLVPYETLPTEPVHGWFNYSGDDNYEDLSVFSMISFYSAAMGGVWTTAEDLAKFAQAIFVDKNVVNEESLTEMMEIYTPITGEPLVAGYGLGIYKFSPELLNGVEIWGHGGDAPGFAAAWMYLPDYNICIGIEDNTEDGNTMWVLNDLIEILIKEMGT